MFFNTFVSERGTPWRVCDAWDEVYSSLSEQLRIETHDSRMVLTHIKHLAEQIASNEKPSNPPFIPRIPKPTEGAFTRIHQPIFPALSAELIQQRIEMGLAKENALHVQAAPSAPRFVPMGPPPSGLQDSRHVFTNSARRLEVLRNCINCIFDNKISDARKTFSAVLRALKTNDARLALCAELSNHVAGSRAILDPAQFDLVARLMNCALQDTSVMDEYGVAAAMLPLATSFCRKLCTGVVQFAYTCIQDHQVWQRYLSPDFIKYLSNPCLYSLQFWEAAFYQDVQRDIKALYLPRTSQSINSSNIAAEVAARASDVSVLEIAAQQMRRWPSMSEELRQELEANEESTIYSQAIHYANRMVYLLIPLEAGERQRKERAVTGHGEHDSVSASVTNTSVAESERSGGDDESGFEDASAGETGASVIRFVSRFVDKVCNEGNVTPEHVRSLYQMIPGVVAMHLETLETVSREAQRLPPIQKPKILTPNLLSGERLLIEGVRVYLLGDGREEGSSAGIGLLPAEGALFLTNYRIIFKGAPCDPLVCEQTIVRAFPITALTKEKRVPVNYLGHLDQWLQEGLQLRSNTFQMLRVAFDEEVNVDGIEQLRKCINRVRHPPHPSAFHYFAFVGQNIVDAAPIHKGKEKSATLKGMAKKTLLKTARQVGLKPKSAAKRKKYILQPPGLGISSMGGGSTTGSGSLLREEDEISNLDEPIARNTSANGSNLISVAHHADPKTLERVVERSYCKDFQRLTLAPSPGTTGTLTPGKAKTDSFRISTANSIYGLCRTYPALLVVPAHMSDESLSRVARCYRHGRLPVVTWRHPRTKG